jgi:hypothetical protein
MVVYYKITEEELEEFCKDSYGLNEFGDHSCFEVKERIKSRGEV